MIILGREQFKKCRVGCCGSVRNDLIYPIGYKPDLKSFKKTCSKVMKEYGKETYESCGDTFSVEQFEGNEGDESRGAGKSRYLFILEDDGSWKFYENEMFICKISNEKELEDWIRIY